MTDQISTKLAALGLALMINGIMIGAVAYLFNGRLHQQDVVQSLARTPLVASPGAAG